MLDRIKAQFDASFAKQSHLHHYHRHGMEADYLKQAREMMETQLGTFYNSGIMRQQ
jgi:hypothetical protein